jgi:hypothetical protein
MDFRWILVGKTANLFQNGIFSTVGSVVYEQK